MKNSSRRLAAAAGVVYITFAGAQPSAPQSQGQRAPTIEDRVAALERGLASVTTRFDVREAAVVPPQNTGLLENRVQTLERTLDRLSQDLQRVERAADSAQRAADAAARDAADARRTAENADRAARDAQMRAH